MFSAYRLAFRIRANFDSAAETGREIVFVHLTGLSSRHYRACVRESSTVAMRAGTGSTYSETRDLPDAYRNLPMNFYTPCDSRRWTDDAQ